MAIVFIDTPDQADWLRVLDTDKARVLVQQRVSGLRRKDRRSIWSGLFNQHRITAKQRSTLRASLLRTFTTQYRRQVQAELETLGYPKRQIILTDPRVKQTLAGLAGEHATLVQRTYNRLLESALAQLPPDISQHDINQALASQISQARQYTSDVLVPYLQGRISDQAQRDFYTINRIDVSWELDHPVSHQPPDETCQETRTRSERGEADTAYRAQTPMPNHRHCQGRWRAKPVPGATLPPPEQLWDGDVTHALVEAKNQGLVCKVARRYPRTPVPQLQSRYQTLLLALDEIRRSPVVYGWLRDRVLLDLAAVQLEVTLQGYPEVLSEQWDSPPLLLALEEVDPAGGIPLDDPRNHQASQPVLMGDDIPGETLRGEVITKSAHWEEEKHPRGEHGHFASTRGSYPAPAHLEDGSKALYEEHWQKVAHVLGVDMSLVAGRATQDVAARLQGVMSAYDIDEFKRDWEQNPALARSIALRDAVRREFGLTSARPEEGRVSGINPKIQKQADALVRAHYTYVQELLSKAGIEHVHLIRGVNLRDEAFGLGPGEEKEALAHEPPLSSYTRDQEVADHFASQGGAPHYFGAYVPAERIFSPGFLGFGDNYEKEYLVIGGELRVGVRRAGTRRTGLQTKAAVHAEQERLSLAWDPIKHPRGEHGHFATVETHLDRMPENFRAKIDHRLDNLGIRQSDMEKHLYDLATHALGTHNPARDTEFQKARDYFPSVHRFAEHLAGLHGVPLESVAGVIAALSPRRKWKLPLDAKNLDNQAAAARLFDLVSRERAGFEVHVSPELARDFNRQALNTDPAGKAVAVDIAETGPMREGAYQLRDLSPMKAAHVAHTLGYKLSAAAGHVPVARAIAIARTGDVETHLQGPKVRSFYNNIVAPGQTGDVTVDTHVLRAALNEHAITVGRKEYASARDWEKEKKTHTFQSLLFKINGTKEGMGDHTGAYSVVRDAVARVGAEFGLTPDEMQSLVWRESQRKYLGVDPDTAHISARMMGHALTEYELHHDWEQAQAYLYATDIPETKALGFLHHGPGKAWDPEKHPRAEHGHFAHVETQDLPKHMPPTTPTTPPRITREDELHSMNDWTAAIEARGAGRWHGGMSEKQEQDLASALDRVNAQAIAEITGDPKMRSAALSAFQAWSDGSLRPASRALQTAASRLFLLPIRDVSEPRSGEGEKAEDIVHGQYTLTQHILAERGIQHVTLYRGMSFKEKPGELEHLPLSISPEHEIAWGHATLPSRPLSSWSSSFEAARLFADTGGHGYVYAMTVPRERIWSTAYTGAGYMTELEYIVLGGDDTVGVANVA